MGDRKIVGWYFNVDTDEWEAEYEVTGLSRAGETDIERVDTHDGKPLWATGGVPRARLGDPHE